MVQINSVRAYGRIVVRKSAYQMSQWITPTNLGSAAYNHDYTMVLDTTSQCNPTFSIISGKLPTGLVLSPDGVISGTPTELGQFYFVISANDMSTVINRSFCLTISAGTPSWNTNGGRIGTVGLNIPFTMTFDATSDGIVTYSMYGDVPGLILNNNSLMGIPTYPGTYEFFITANDGGSSTTQVFTIIIATLGDFVTTTPSYQPVQWISTTNIGDAHIGSNFSMNLATAGNGVSYTSPNLPSWLELHGGVLSGTPSTEGTYSFTVVATDTITTASQDFTLTITSQTPVWYTNAGNLASVKRGSDVNISVMVEGSSLTYQLQGQLPTGMVMDGNLISGTPTGNTSTFMISCGNGTSTTSRQFTITIL